MILTLNIERTVIPEKPALRFRHWVDLCKGGLFEPKSLPKENGR